MDATAHENIYSTTEEVCHGQEVVLTHVIDFSYMDWFYNGMGLGSPGPINTTRDVLVSGFTFSLEITSRGYYPGELISTLSFRADAAMNGTEITCEFYVRHVGGVGIGWVLIFSEECKYW